MIIDDSITFFGIYYHNCVLNFNLTKQFSDLYSKIKYQNIILCQKDHKGGYLLTQSMNEKAQADMNIKSYYFLTKKELKEGFKNINKSMDYSEKTFYLLRSSDNLDIKDSEQIVAKWKKEVKDVVNMV